jgi:hypothetical protein
LTAGFLGAGFFICAITSCLFSLRFGDQSLGYQPLA